MSAVLVEGRGRRAPVYRTLTAMLLVSAVCSVLGAAFPMSPEAPVELNAGNGLAALVLAALAWWRPHRCWVHVGPLALVCGVTSVVAVAATGVGAAGTAMTYLWVTTYAAFFLPRAVARRYAALVVVAFGAALLVNPFQGAPNVWLLCSISAVVAAEAVGSVVAALAQQARTDPLTGALNREGLRVAAARLLPGRVMAVAVDLDGFKQVNDAHGHAAGDRLLVDLVEAWRPVLRSEDVLARLGGDEFVLLLPRADAGEAAAVVDRLRAASATPWSAGLAEAARDDDLDALLARADRRLYAAKRSAYTTVA